jgi:DeoR family transcriptional regulator, aga operon transcriptional repressor
VRKQERLSAILDRVAERGSVDVSDLARALGVSGATVRRDLQALSSGKLLVRTHGGAVARLVDTGDGASHLAQKRRIGAAAAGPITARWSA